MGYAIICRWFIIPTLGSKGPKWGPYDLISPSVSLSISLYLCISFCLSVRFSVSPFGYQSAWPIIAFSTCGRRPQVVQYNIYSSTSYPHWVLKDPSGVQSRLYIRPSVRPYVRTCVHTSVRPSVSKSLCISVYLSISLSLCLIVRVAFVDH